MDSEPGQKSTIVRATWTDFTLGLEDVRGQLKIYLQAAGTRPAPGPLPALRNPGLGSTTLAQIMPASWAGIGLTSGPVLERSGDLAAIP
jgi:Holliday junction DNA helicase RuvB